MSASAGKRKMSSYHSYWEGDELAWIEEIPVTVIRHYREDAAKAMNFAFLLYYYGMRFAKGVKQADAKAGKVLRDDLRAAATSGWGFGVKDLEDAFEHVADNDGRWSDNKAKPYYGALGRYGAVPVAAFNFFGAIDSRMAEARTLADQHEKASERMAAALEVGTPQWQKAGEALSTIQTISGNMERFLWLVPVAVAGGPSIILHRVDAVVDMVEKGNEIGSKFLSAISDTRAAVETFDSAMRAGFTTEQGLLLAALQKVAGAVPVLGEVYAQAICLIPEIASMFQTIVETRNQQMLHALYNAGEGQKFLHVGSTH